MPREEAEGVSLAAASTVVAPIPAPRAFNMRPIVTATTAPAMMAPQEIRDGREGAPSGRTALAVLASL
jgi:hypothetical protein